MRWWAELPGKLLGPMFTLDAVRVGRRTSTFVTRWVYLGGLTVVLSIFFWGATNRMQSTNGVVAPSVLASFAEEFFWVYAVTQFLVVVALTPAFTAAAITDEKERKTLDFLLVTDLSTREIVFGKLASRAGLLFTLVLAGLPILSLIQFFGGIDPDLLMYAVAMTAATVVSMAALGIACSVLLSRTRDAVVLAYVVPLGYVILSSIWAENSAYAARQNADWSFSLLGKYTITGDGLARTVAAGNPFVAVPAINGRTAVAGDSGGVVAWYCGFHLLVAAIGFAYSSLRLRAVARAVGGSAAPKSTAGRALARLRGHRTTARPHPEVTDHPVAWREVYVEPGSGSGVLRTLLSFAVVGIVAFSFFNIVLETLLSGRHYNSWTTPEREFRGRTKAWVCLVTGGLGSLMMLGATVRGASSVAGEKDRDTWTNLLTTPLTTGEILWGKWWGCVWGQRWSIYLLCGVWAVGILTLSVNPVSVVLAAVALAVYLTAFAWLGVSCSVKARSARSAITRAVPQAIFFGGGFWLLLGCCCVAGASAGGEVTGHLVGFVLGFTPPVVLGGLPAIDSEVLDWNRRQSWPIAFVIVAGGVCGTAAWFAGAMAWKRRAHELMEVEANRRAHEQPSPPRPSAHPPRGPLNLRDIQPLPRRDDSA